MRTVLRADRRWWKWLCKVTHSFFIPVQETQTYLTGFVFLQGEGAGT